MHDIDSVNCGNLQQPYRVDTRYNNLPGLFVGNLHAGMVFLCRKPTTVGHRQRNSLTFVGIHKSQECAKYYLCCCECVLCYYYKQENLSQKETIMNTAAFTIETAEATLTAREFSTAMSIAVQYPTAEIWQGDTLLIKHYADAADSI